MRRFKVAIGALAVAGLALSACGSSGSGQGSKSSSSTAAAGQTTSVRLGLVVAHDFDEELPQYVALHRGYFKAEGLKVTVTAFQGGADAVKAVAAGNVDILAGTGPDSPAAVSKGVPLKVFAGVAQKNDLVLIAGPKSGITSLADIKGKRIGITKFGSLTDFIARIEAQKAGLTDKQIKEVALGGIPALLAGLSSGAIDAFNGPLSASLIAQQAGKGHIVAHFANIHPQDQFTVLEASPKYLSSHTATVKKFLQAYYKAITYLKSNPSYGVKATEGALALKPPIAKKVYDDLAPLLSSDGAVNTTGLETYAKVQVGLGIAPTTPKLSQYYTGQFLPVKVH